MKHRVILSAALVGRDSIQLSSGDSHHLLNVLRLDIGSGIELVVPGQGVISAGIISIDNNRVVVVPGEVVEGVQDRESPLRIHVVMPFLKGVRTDWAVQKAVEAGVARFSVGIMEYSVVRPFGMALENRLKRLHRVIDAACKQSRRSLVPAVESFQNPEDLVYPGLVFVLDTLSKQGIGQSLERLGIIDAVTLVIGPEGGLSGNERAFFIRQGCRMVSMGPRVLRAETAVVAGVVALQTRLGDMR